MDERQISESTNLLSQLSKNVGREPTNRWRSMMPQRKLISLGAIATSLMLLILALNWNSSQRPKPATTSILNTKSNEEQGYASVDIDSLIGTSQYTSHGEQTLTEENPPSALTAEYTSNGKPHVVFLLVDDQGWADMVPNTPDLEFALPFSSKFMKQSIHFTNHYSMHLCTPSRASLLTGKHVIRLGMWAGVISIDASYGLPNRVNGEDVLIMPQYFKSLGYSTSMVGKWHLGHYSTPLLPQMRGFDTYFGYLLGGEHYFSHLSVYGIEDEFFHDFYSGNGSHKGNCSVGYEGTYGPSIFVDKFAESITSLVSEAYGDSAVQILDNTLPDFGVLPSSSSGSSKDEGRKQGKVEAEDEAENTVEVGGKEQYGGDWVGEIGETDTGAGTGAGAGEQDEANKSKYSSFGAKMAAPLQEKGKEGGGSLDLDMEGLVQYSREQAKRLHQAAKASTKASAATTSTTTTTTTATTSSVAPVAAGGGMVQGDDGGDSDGDGEDGDLMDPVFYYFSSQLVHNPLDYLHNSSFSDEEMLGITALRNPGRDRFARMTIMFDRQLSLLYQILAHRGMLQDTVLVVASDNGGCTDQGGYNTPYRGKKAFLFEGGIKTHAFLHSPLLSPAVRGSEYTNLFTIYDWLPTLMAAVGSPWDVAEPRYRDMDGVDHWGAVLGLGLSTPTSPHLAAALPAATTTTITTTTTTTTLNPGPDLASPPRIEFLINLDDTKHAIRYGDMKLVVGEMDLPWYSPEGRHGTELDDDVSQEIGYVVDCASYNGTAKDWLFNITADKRETVNLYYDTKYTDWVKFLKGRIEFYRQFMITNEQLVKEREVLAYDTYSKCGCICPWNQTEEILLA